jgi:ribosomal protein S18 acetylase RimI-like enzyme
MSFLVRDFESADADKVNEIALAAFAQYRDNYHEWPALAQRIGQMSALSTHGELMVAAQGDAVLGAVAYVGPLAPKSPAFDQSWPIIRMLVVAPVARGRGIGRALTEACLRRARRDGAREIGLHTSPIMVVALAMYLRMGFVRLRSTPEIHGVAYAIYLKRLEPMRGQQ